VSANFLQWPNLTSDEFGIIAYIPSLFCGKTGEGDPAWRPDFRDLTDATVHPPDLKSSEILIKHIGSWAHLPRIKQRSRWA
jgi:hypothetical protein